MRRATVTRSRARSGSIDRALRILEAFVRIDGAIGPSELATRLGLSKATVFRYLNAFVRTDWAIQDGPTGRYRIGPRAVSCLVATTLRFPMLQMCRPIMRDLGERTRETVTLFVPVGTCRVCVGQIESPHEIKWSTEIGRRYPLTVGAAGRVILAEMPEQQLEEVLRHAEFPRYTARSPRGREELLEGLEFVRTHGYAISRGETVDNSWGVAAPVRNIDGDVVVALSIGGPNQRLKSGMLESFGELLKRAVRNAAGWPGNSGTAPHRRRREASR